MCYSMPHFICFLAFVTSFVAVKTCFFLCFELFFYCVWRIVHLHTMLVVACHTGSQQRTQSLVNQSCVILQSNSSLCVLALCMSSISTSQKAVIFMTIICSWNFVAKFGYIFEIFCFCEEISIMDSLQHSVICIVFLTK